MLWLTCRVMTRSVSSIVVGGHDMMIDAPAAGLTVTRQSFAGSTDLVGSPGPHPRAAALAMAVRDLLAQQDQNGDWQFTLPGP